MASRGSAGEDSGADADQSLEPSTADYGQAADGDADGEGDGEGYAEEGADAMEGVEARFPSFSTLLLPLPPWCSALYAVPALALCVMWWHAPGLT